MLMFFTQLYLLLFTFSADVRVQQQQGLLRLSHVPLLSDEGLQHWATSVWRQLHKRHCVGWAWWWVSFLADRKPMINWINVVIKGFSNQNCLFRRLGRSGSFQDVISQWRSHWSGAASFQTGHKWFVFTYVFLFLVVLFHFGWYQAHK